MDSPPSRRNLGWLALAIGFLLAFWLYQPWQARSFDVLDFSEFLPLLNASHSLLGRFASLLHYYADAHGRLNLLGYASIAAKWTWLGPHPLLWQLLRAGELIGIGCLVFVLLRRLAASTWGAALGSLVFFFSYSAALPWVRLTMGEPLGLGFALGAALLATRLSGSREQVVPLGLGAGLLLAAAILTKEMLALWVPVVLWIAFSRGPDGKLGAARRGRPELQYALCVVGLALAAALPVLYVARHGQQAGYAATYGAAPLTPARFLEIFQRQLLPWPITGRSDGTVMLLATLLFVGVVMAGLRAGLRQPGTRPQVLRVIGLGLGLPALGALLYLPWPVYNPFYGYPFLFGGALLLATAVSGLEAAGLRVKRVTIAATLATLGLVAPQAVHLAGAALAQQRVMTATARALGQLRGTDRIAVAVAQLPAQAWQGIGPSLARYAIATTPGLALPPIQDVLCSDAAKLLNEGHRVGLVTLSTNCGLLPAPTLATQSAYSYWRWEPPGFGRDSIRAELLLLR